METLKNLLSGNKNDDTVSSSSTATSQNTGLASETSTGHSSRSGLTGEGSHLSSNRDTVGSGNSGLPGSNTTVSGLGNTQTTQGPPDSNLVNKADPRVDSYGSRSLGNSQGAGYSSTGGAGGLGNTSADNEYVPSSGKTQGSHSSNLANQADPRVDSDGSKALGPTEGYGSTGVISGRGNTTSAGDNYGSSSAGSGSTGTSTGLGNTTSSRDNFGGSSAEYGSTGTASGLGNTTSTHDSYEASSGTTTGPHSSSLANKADPRVDSDRYGSKTLGNTGHSGPHTTEAANRLDPAINTSSGLGLESAHHHSKKHGGGAEEADTHHSKGRDTAIGAGGVGLAEHEHQKYQVQRDTGVGSSTGTTSLGSSTGGYDNTTSTGSVNRSSHLRRNDAPGAGSAGTAAHEHRGHESNRGTDAGSSTGSTALSSSSSPYAPSSSTGVHQESHFANTPGSSTLAQGITTHQSHLGHDAGIGAVGVGATGVAAHEHDKHQTGIVSNLPGPAPNTAGPHKKDWMNKLDPRVDANPNKAQSTGHGPMKAEEGHTARDTAIVGSLGGAGAYEAEKHHQKHDKDLTESERAAKKEHKHELKEEKREHKEEKMEEKREHKESKGGLLSFLHRDKSKKYSPEDEAEFDRQEREHNSQKSRDGAGGAALGGAAYEAEKHQHQHTDTNKPLPTAPGNHGIGTGAGTGNALAGDNTTTSHTTGTPLPEKPRGTDLGDKLHGIARNRGVPGNTGFPSEKNSATGSGIGSTSTGHQDHHYGRDATAVGGATALGEHEHRKHETSTSGIGNQSSGVTSSAGTGDEHHLDRDVGIAAGGVGLAEHEHRKHEGTSHHNNTSSGLTGSKTTGTGLGSSNITGLGSSNKAVGGGEYRKGDYTSGEQYGQQSGSTGGQSSGLTGQSSGLPDRSSGLTGSNYDSNTTDSKVASGSDDYNKLHKDPPAGHPAAGGVPASGSERENLVKEGEQRLDDDSGVAHAHSQGGTSNY